ncbi:MAG: DNA starvation/stationary phase protection protein [Candidimonas sp.]
MKTSLASSFVLYLKTHGFHWNVIGDDFPQLHNLFGDQYEEIWEAIDDFAEKIRQLESYAPQCMQRFINLSVIDEQPKIITAEAMITELANDNEKLISQLNDTFAHAERVGDQALMDFIAGRLDAHKKHLWMLKSTNK